MALLVSLLIGTQILCSLAGLHPHREPPPPPPAQLTSSSCNSSSVKIAAELALDKLNKDRTEGYVFGLQRIFDVYELQWRDTGVVYYLTLDVLETKCHVLSRKFWKDCEFRPAHESVYGQCKATLYMNRPWRILHLFNYDCGLHSLPAAAIVKTCPDCPTPEDPTQPKFWDAATLSLEKFNKESNHTHYFKLVNVSRATSQWVIGPSNFVEYVVQETSCPKSQATDNVSSCSFLPDDKADVGVCKGSVIESRIEHQTFVTTSCEIFHPQVSGGRQTGDRKPGHHDDHDESHEDDGHSEGGRKGHHDGHHGGRRRGHHDGHSEERREGHQDGHSEGRRGGHQDGHSEGGREGHHDGHSEGRRGGHHDGHSEGGRGGHHDGHSEGRRGGHHNHHHHDHHPRKHHRHHKNDSHDHAEHGPPTSDTFEASTHLGKTVGRVVVLPLTNTHISLHSLPNIGAERLDGVPVPPQSQGPKSIPNLPDIHGAPDESRPLGKPMGHPPLTKPFRPVTPPPFPNLFSQSDTCPGEILVSIHGLEPLLPKRPVDLSPAKEKVKE